MDKATCSASSSFEKWGCENAILSNKKADWAIATREYGAVGSWLKIVLSQDRMFSVSRVFVLNRQYYDHGRFFSFVCVTLFFKKKRQINDTLHWLSNLKKNNTHLFIGTARNKEIELSFASGQHYTVKMSQGRKTSYDVILKPTALTSFIKFKVLAAYSEQYNGFAMVRIWYEKQSVPKWKPNLKLKWLPSPLRSVGIWGPWELCPKGQMVVNWQLKWDKEVGVTGR